jgi:hypothetical protein
MTRYLVAYINTTCELRSEFADNLELEIGEEASPVEIVEAERLAFHRFAYSNHPWFPVCAYHDAKRTDLEDSTVFSVYREAENGDLVYLGAVREDLLNPYVADADEETMSKEDWKKKQQQLTAHSERWDVLYPKLIAYVRGMVSYVQDRPSRIERGTDEERYALIAREVAAKNWELLQPENRVEFIWEVEEAFRKLNTFLMDLPSRNGSIRWRAR